MPSSADVNGKATQLMEAILDAGENELMDQDSAGLAHDLAEIIAKYLAYNKFEDAMEALDDIVEATAEDDEEDE